MTLEKLNAFIAETENAMTAQERTEWMVLSKLERQCAAYAAYIAIHGAYAPNQPRRKYVTEFGNFIIPESR